MIEMNNKKPIYLDKGSCENLIELYSLYFYQMIYDLHDDIDNIDWAISMLDIFQQARSALAEFKAEEKENYTT